MNHESSDKFPNSGTDASARARQDRFVTYDPDSNWHLHAWFEHFEKRQASLVNELGWAKNKAHKVWHGVQPYRRDEVEEIAAWLGIRPFELLMPPTEALALRRLRETAALIVAEAAPQVGSPLGGKQTRKAPAR